jgi:hypothetical protein
MVLQFVLSVVLSLFFGGLGLLWIKHLSVAWRKRGKTGSQLPEGSLGVPILGESLSLSVDPLAYNNDRIKRCSASSHSACVFTEIITQAAFYSL